MSKKRPRIHPSKAVLLDRIAKAGAINTQERLSEGFFVLWDMVARREI